MVSMCFWALLKKSIFYCPLLIIPKYKTELGKKTVKIYGCTAWNELSNEVKSIENQKSFRKAIKEDILPYVTS